MKKLFVVLMFAIVILGQSTETVTELQMEKGLAERIENMLFPIVGKTIVDVNLTLLYPSEGLIPFGMELNRNESLPGLPVAKSKGILPNKIDGKPTLPTQITAKKIVVYVDKLMETKKIEFIKENVTNWARIDATDLTIKKTLSMKNENFDSISWQPLYAIVAIFLLLALIFIFMFNSKIKQLSESMRAINISGFDKAIRIMGNLQTQTAEKKSEKFFEKGPLPIKIVESNKEEDSSFNFLESLSTQDFVQLIDKKEIAFILTILSNDFTNKFFVEFKDDSSFILDEMLSVSQKTKDEVAKLRNKLFQKYLEFMENKQLSFGGKDAIVNIINELPSAKAKEMLAKVQKTNSKIATEIRAKIFLLDDVLTLEKEKINQIIDIVDRNFLVSFLACVDKSAREVFLQNMTSRTRAIIQEDVDVIGVLDDASREHSINLMLTEIRKILR
ncbi:MAG: hypothetical protein HN952_02875 [Candidatus Cloacimonetes bacterium]|jgi:hypothetical protein|nr:hypothetical protein [Candidatus Cloacimonadota bacterium]